MEGEKETKKEEESVKKWEAKQTFEGKNFGNVGQIWPLSSSTVLCKTEESLRVIDTASRSVLKTIDTKENGCIVGYVPSQKVLLVARGNYMKLFAPIGKESPPVLPLDRIVIKEDSLKNGYSFNMDTSANNTVTIKLPLHHSMHLVKAIQGLEENPSEQLTEANTADLKTLETQLTEANNNLLKENKTNKELQWCTVEFSLPFKNLKEALQKIIDANIFYEFEANCVIQRILEMMRRSSATIDAEFAATTHNNMNSEICRFLTFKNYPQSSNEQATPANFAAAGMYVKPTQYEDEIICFKCMYEFAGWDNLGSPWEEHQSQNPNCAFINQTDASNIDMASSRNGQPYQKSAGTDTNIITEIITSDSFPYVATVSKEGIVTVWETNTLLKQLCSFSPLENEAIAAHNLENATFKSVVFLPARTTESEDKEDCTFASFIEGSNKSLMNIYAVKSSSCKLLFSVTVDTASLLHGCYVPSQKKLCVATRKGVKLYTCAYEEENLRIEEAKSPEDLSFNDVEELVALYYQPELADTVYILSNMGRLFTVDTTNSQKPTVLSLNGSVKYLDFSCDGKTVFVSTDQGLLCYAISEAKPSPVLVQSEEIFGALTLSNLLPLKLSDSDKLLFASFPPPNLKQTGEVESSGTIVTWDIGMYQDGFDTPREEFKFEIELPKVCLVDSVQLSFGFTPVPSVVEDKHIEGPYKISLSYLDERTGTVTKLYDKLDLTAKLNNSDEITTTGPEEEEFRTRSLNLDALIITRFIYLSLHTPPQKKEEEESDKARYVEILEFSVLGVSTNIEATLEQRKKRKSLLDSNDFLISLLETSQNPGTLEGLRNLCLELLVGAVSNPEKLLLLRKVLNFDVMINNCIILEGSSTARLAAKLIHKIITELSKDSASTIKDEVVRSCVSLLPKVISSCKSAVGMSEFFGLVTACWNSTISFSSFVDTLKILGDRLYLARSPFYNMLRTHFGLYGFPLESGQFQHRISEANFIENDELPVAALDQSTHASYETKTKKIRIKDIHRKGNWVTLDFGAPCLVTDVILNWQNDNYHFLVQVDTWMETGDIPRRLLYKKVQLPTTPKPTNEVPKLSATQLACSCRYMKISVNAASSAYGVLNVDVRIHGIHDYISPLLPHDLLLAKLATHIENAQQKLYSDTQEFEAKKRELTTVLEEMNAGGVDIESFKTKVTVAFDDCTQAKQSYNKTKRRLKRLFAIKREMVDPKVEDIVLDSCDVDRWMEAADHISAILAKQKERIANIGVAKELFKYFCIFGAPTSRKQVSNLLSLQLDEWEGFPSDVITKYFSSTSSVSPIDLFPQQDVFDILKEMILAFKGNRWIFINNLFTLVEKFLPKNDTKSTQSKFDVSLISWVCLFLSELIASMNSESSIVHPGTRCDSCQKSPITGTRFKCMNCSNFDLCEQCEVERDKVKHNELHVFLQIPKPLPLYPSATLPQPTADTSKKDYPPLLNVLYKVGETFSEAFADTKKVTHDGVTCDGCGKNPITGVRFRCVNCDQFNMCSDCIGKVEHYPLHLFAKIYFPLPNDGKQPTKALIQNTDLIPLVLHHSSPALKKKKIAASADYAAETQSAHSGRLLYTIFSLLSLPDLNNREVILLASHILQLLAKQHLPDDVFNEVFQHPNFKQFLQRFANHADAFLRSAVLDMIEVFCKEESYRKETTALPSIRNFLRDLGSSMLAKHPAEAAAAFLIELLLIVTPSKDVAELQSKQEKKASLSWRTSSAPSVLMRPKEPVQVTHPLHEVTSNLIAYLNNCQLAMSSARAWCMCFRLFQLGDTQQVVKSLNITQVIHSTLDASHDIQVVLKPDWQSFVTLLLAQREIGIQTTLFNLLVDMTPSALRADQDPVLFSTLIAVTKSDLDAKTTPFDLQRVISLLKAVASALPDFGKAQAVEKSKNEMVRSMVELLNKILPILKDDHTKIVGDNTDSKHFTRLLVDWIGKYPDAAGNPLAKKLKTLQDEVIKLVLTLASNETTKKHFLLLCFNLLKTDQTTAVASLSQQLITDEKLAHYFAVELKVGDYLLSQIGQSSKTLPSSHLSVSSAIQKHMKSKAPKNAKTVVTSGSLENLHHLAEIVNTTDAILPNLLKAEQSSVWVYHYKDNEQEHNIDISFSSDVILKEIQINIYINYSSSQLPAAILVSTGISPTRLVTVGHYPCSGGQHNANSNSNLYKLAIPGSEVIKFVRLGIQKNPKNSNIAIGRMLLRGRTFWNSSSSSSSPQLPIDVTLSLLSHFSKFNNVQKHLAQHPSISAVGLSLLDKLAPQTHATIQDILLSLAQHNPKLSQALLDQLSEAQAISTSFQADLVGKLCSFEDESSIRGLHSLQNYFFKQLAANQNSLPSSLMPILSALSYAISNHVGSGRVHVTKEQLSMLLYAASHTIVGSLMEENFLKLMSSLIQADSKVFEDLLNSQNISALFESDMRNLQLIGILATSCEPAAQYLLKSPLLKEAAEKAKGLQHVSNTTTQRTMEPLFSFFAELASIDSIKAWIGDTMLLELLSRCTKLDAQSGLYIKLQSIFSACCNLNPKIQHQVAKFFYDYVQEASATPISQQSGKTPTISLPKNMQRLMVNMFSLEDKIPTCLHPLKGNQARSDEILGKDEGVPKVDVLNLDPELTHPSIDIDGRTATVTFRATYEWATSIGTLCMESGVHKWEVVVENTKSNNIMIGVCEKKHPLQQFIGTDSTGWAYYAHNPGYKYHQSSAEIYAEPYGAGDVIGITLDLNQGTLAFTKNGIDMGIAYSTDLLGKKLYPAVSLLEPEDCVVFRNYSNVSSKKSAKKSLTPDQQSPHHFHRFDFIVYVAAQTTLSQLESDLGGGKSVTFRPMKSSKLLPPSTSLDQVMKEEPTTVHNGILDLTYEVSSTPPAKIDTKSKKSKKIFELFAKQGGLHKLVSALYTSLTEKGEKSEETEHYSKWSKWLTELSSYLHLPGYERLFISKDECCMLLFHLMKGEQEPTSDDLTKLVTHPLLPLHEILVQLFTEAPSDSALRKNFLSSDALLFLLVRLGDQSSTSPRKLERFERIIKLGQKKSTTNKEKKKKEGKTGKKYWAKGTGYGTNQDAQSDWNHADYMKEQQSKAKQITNLLQILNLYLTEKANADFTDELFSLLEDSCLTPMLESYLRNDSLFDMGRQISLYRTLLQLVRCLVSQEKLLPLLDTHHQSTSIYDLISNLASMADVIMKRTQKAKAKEAKEEKDKDKEKEKEKEITEKDAAKEPTKDKESEDQNSSDLANIDPDLLTAERFDVSDEDQMLLAGDIMKTHALLQKYMDRYRKLHSKEEEETENKETDADIVKLYAKALRPLQFSERSMTNSKGEYDHHYKARITSDAMSMTGAKAKRLIQEVATLSNGLPLYVESSVFLCVDENRLDVMQCLITGPSNTPYDSGCFLFDIYCPPEYPEQPPLVNLETTGGGSVRFNPNLYNCGKVCLSLLGTWSGGTNEKWDPLTSTLLQVFVSIQSLIFVSLPYFNEPGYEASMGTPQGTKASNDYNEVIRQGTLKWAIIEQLRTPSPGFEEVIKTHFKLKKDSILKIVCEWVKDAQSSKTAGYSKKMQALFEELKAELNKLDPPTAVKKTEEPSAPVVATDQ